MSSLAWLAKWPFKIRYSLKEMLVFAKLIWFDFSKVQCNITQLQLLVNAIAIFFFTQDFAREMNRIWSYGYSRKCSYI